MKKKMMVMGGALLMSAMLVQLAVAERGSTVMRARLSGFQEAPAVSTEATGNFWMKIDRDDTEFEYELSYSDLEGTVTQAHIHLGQPGVSGGIMIWLCGTSTNPGPAGTPVCPASGGSPVSVSGTVTAANVVGPAGQGIAAGEFAEALHAARRGFGYANVHSSKVGTGEIRGQIHQTDDLDRGRGRSGWRK